MGARGSDTGKALCGPYQWMQAFLQNIPPGEARSEEESIGPIHVVFGSLCFVCT